MQPFETTCGMSFGRLPAELRERPGIGHRLRSMLRVWSLLSYDPKLDFLCHGTGHPRPWNPEQRPGCRPAARTSGRCKAPTPDGRQLYVACGRSDAVSVIDTAAGVRLADIVVGKLTWGVAIR